MREEARDEGDVDEEGEDEDGDEDEDADDDEASCDDGDLSLPPLGEVVSMSCLLSAFEDEDADEGEILLMSDWLSCRGAACEWWGGGRQPDVARMHVRWPSRLPVAFTPCSPSRCCHSHPLPHLRLPAVSMLVLPCQAVYDNRSMGGPRECERCDAPLIFPRATHSDATRYRHGPPTDGRTPRWIASHRSGHVIARSAIRISVPSCHTPVRAGAHDDCRAKGTFSQCLP